MPGLLARSLVGVCKRQPIHVYLLHIDVFLLFSPPSPLSKIKKSALAQQFLKTETLKHVLRVGTVNIPDIWKPMGTWFPRSQGRRRKKGMRVPLAVVPQGRGY